MLYDAAIIGTGPAGLSAALTLHLHNKSLVWFGSRELSAKVGKSECIANLPGLPMISGTELNARFQAQIAQAGLEIADHIVTTVTPMEDRYLLLADNEIYEAKTLLLATGFVAPQGFDGEQRLLGRGVSSCATCDGFLYKGKTIAVYCATLRYEHEVEYLAGLAQTVYLSAPYQDCHVQAANVQRLPSPIRAICGETRVESITLANGSTVPVEGVFCLRDAVALDALLPGLARNGAHITVNRAMKTNLPGCFAAGDCTGRPYQLTKAMGEGNTAAHSMIEFLAQK